MRDAKRLLLLLLAACVLGGCNGHGFLGPDYAHGRGRYAGVGIYGPGAGWARQIAGQGATTAAARLSDDEAVIVVVDSQTGEVRACGDLSGYCIGINPWRSALARPQQTPVGLTKHASPPEPATNDADNAAAPSNEADDKAAAPSR